MHRVAAVQDPLDTLRVQSRTSHDPVQPVPDPGRPVRDERHGLGPRRSQAMEVEGQQFHQVVRPVHRGVDPGACALEHPPLAVAQVKDQELRLAPLDPDLAAMLHPLALGGLNLRADPDPPAVDLGDDVLPSHFLASREQPIAESPQVTGPSRQDLGPQLVRHAVDRLLVERRALAAEFVAGRLDRREQGGQAPHLALQRRGRPLADAQGRQLGINPGAFAAPAPCGAGPGTAVGRGDPDDQAAQEAEFQPPRLRGAS